MIAYFNDDIKNKYAKDFCDLYQLQNLIKGPTGFKNPENPTTIDLMLTNSRNSFCNSCCFETGLLDFHRMTVTVLKTHFHKQKPKNVKHRDYKSFSNDNFRHLIIQESFNLKDPISLSSFLEICHPVLNITAPINPKKAGLFGGSFFRNTESQTQ